MGNETFQLSIEAFDMVKTILTNPSLSKRVWGSRAEVNADADKWSESDNELYRKIAARTSVSVTYLSGDNSFFVSNSVRSYIIIMEDKALLYRCSLLKKSEIDPLESCFEFRIYCRRIDSDRYITAGIYHCNTSNSEQTLRVLSDWPVLAINDADFEELGFTVDRWAWDPMLGPHIDEFGDQDYPSTVTYLKNGVSYRI